MRKLWTVLVFTFSLAFACAMLSCGATTAQGTVTVPAPAPADGTAAQELPPRDDFVTVFISNQNMSYVRVYVSEYEGDRGFRIASLASQQTERVVLRIHPDRKYCVTVSELAGQTRLIDCVELTSGMTVKITITQVLGFSTVVPGMST